VLTPLSFSDVGRYLARLQGGFRARLRVRIRGTITPDLLRWRGSFRVRAAIFRDGQRVDTCRLTGLRWSARLRD
jgi:hypothetical protein